MNEMLNPHAHLTPVPMSDGPQGIPSISDTRAGPATSIIGGDLAQLASYGPGPMPWEVAPGGPPARFKEQDVP